MPEITDYLLVRTQNLRDEIEWIKASRGADSQAALEHLRQIRAELSASGSLLRDPELSSGETAQKLVADYRDCLQRLQEALPILQSDLLAQHYQLQPQRQHVDAASKWLDCHKTTLR